MGKFGPKESIAFFEPGVAFANGAAMQVLDGMSLPRSAPGKKLSDVLTQASPAFGA